MHEEEVICLKLQKVCDRARKLHGIYWVPVRRQLGNKHTEGVNVKSGALTRLPVNGLCSFDRMYLSSGILLTSHEMILTVLTSASVLVVYELSYCKVDIGNMMDE